MSYKRYCRRKREKSLQQIAIAEKKKYDNSMKGFTKILVPHPTLPHTMIERLIEA